MRRLTAGDIDLRLRPAEGSPAGALILNHGRGADENDLWPLLDALDPERRLLGVTTGAPFVAAPAGGRHWYIVERIGYPDGETFHHSYGALGEALDSVLSEHGLDMSDAVLGGFSQGAVMSYALALGAGRPTPAGLLAFSGFIPEVSGWEPELRERSGLRALVHHGSADPVIDPEFGRRAARSLQDAGIDIEHLETAVGHGIPQEAVAPAQVLVAGATGRESVVR